jgi:hypothetical protein
LIQQNNTQFTTIEREKFYFNKKKKFKKNLLKYLLPFFNKKILNNNIKQLNLPQSPYKFKLQLNKDHLNKLSNHKKIPNFNKLITINTKFKLEFLNLIYCTNKKYFVVFNKKHLIIKLLSLLTIIFNNYKNISLKCNLTPTNNVTNIYTISSNTTFFKIHSILNQNYEEIYNIIFIKQILTLKNATNMKTNLFIKPKILKLNTKTKNFNLTLNLPKTLKLKKIKLQFTLRTKLLLQNKNFKQTSLPLESIANYNYYF